MQESTLSFGATPGPTRTISAKDPASSSSPATSGLYPRAVASAVERTAIFGLVAPDKMRSMDA